MQLNQKRNNLNIMPMTSASNQSVVIGKKSNKKKKRKTPKKR